VLKEYKPFINYCESNMYVCITNPVLDYTLRRRLKNPFTIQYSTEYNKYKETEKPLYLYSTIYKEAKNTQIRKE
jgi:hypothetical protein